MYELLAGIGIALAGILVVWVFLLVFTALF